MAAPRLGTTKMSDLVKEVAPPLVAAWMVTTRHAVTRESRIGIVVQYNRQVYIKTFLAITSYTLSKEVPSTLQ